MKNKMKMKFIIIFIILLLLFSIFLVNKQKKFKMQQLNYVNNSELIIETNYQNGIIISETSIYAISENFCEKITIPINLSDYKYTNKNLPNNQYYIKYKNDMADDYEIKSNTDPQLNKLDEKIVKSILLDAKKNHSNANKKFSDDPKYNKYATLINRATLTCFENSDYYLISIEYKENDSSAYIIVNEMIYKGKKFINEILLDGEVESLITMEK